MVSNVFCFFHPILGEDVLLWQTSFLKTGGSTKRQLVLSTHSFVYFLKERASRISSTLSSPQWEEGHHFQHRFFWVFKTCFFSQKSNLSPGIFWMIRKRPNKMTSIFLDTPEFKALESQPFPKTHFQSVAFAKGKWVWMQMVLWILCIS